MGKKIRDKKKKEKPRKKIPQTRKKKGKTKPETITKKVIKSGTENELEKELEKLNQANKYNPTKNAKNKEKRRELVMMRSSLKKRLKAKLRRKHQKRKEELNSDEDNDNIYIPKQTPKTIDMMREIDENMIDENDEEIKESLNEDEYKNYFNGEYEPQILLTTSIKHTGGIYKFIRELKNLIPNSYFYYRKKYDLGTIMKKSIEKGFSDIIVITERLRKPYKILLIHLPNGPTLEFKLFNVIYQNEIEGHGTSSGHNPELMFKNFKTNLGYRIKRCLNAIFPKNEELKGRELITFHNQRDYIFFRYYRYIFEEENEDNNNSNIKVKLQEIGPRFVMRLLYVQKGLFDPQFGEYEWLYNDKMGVKRRKFYL